MECVLCGNKNPEELRKGRMNDYERSGQDDITCIKCISDESWKETLAEVINWL